MNCPSRTEEPKGTGFNQNPSALAADLTTRQDLNGIANARVLRRIASREIEHVVEHLPDDGLKKNEEVMAKVALASEDCHVGERGVSSFEVVNLNGDDNERRIDGGRGFPVSSKWFIRLRNVVLST
jgi:metal iron transporter